MRSAKQSIKHGCDLPRHLLQSIQETRQFEGRDAAKVILRGKLEVDRHDALEVLPGRWRASTVVPINPCVCLSRMSACPRIASHPLPMESHHEHPSYT